MSSADCPPRAISESTLAAIYTDHHRWLFDWLRRRLGCADNAADVAQDTFLRLLVTRDALFGMREPRAWLTTTAKRLLIDRGRRELLEQAYLAELAAMGDALPGYPAPEQILAALQALEQIAAILAAVKPRARDAFLLHYLDGLPQGEVAAYLGVSTRMVRNYLVEVLVQCAELAP